MWVSHLRTGISEVISSSAFNSCLALLDKALNMEKSSELQRILCIINMVSKMSGMQRGPFCFRDGEIES